MPTGACSKVSRNSFSRSIAYCRTLSDFEASSFEHSRSSAIFANSDRTTTSTSPNSRSFGVHGAKRAHGLAIAGKQGNAEVRAHARRGRHQRVVRKARVRGRIAHDQRLALPDRVIA